MSDDNKVKFLKIQYSLLRALKEKKEKAINNVIYEQIENEIKRELIKYKELVTSIDRGIYLELKDKISLFKPHTKSLEEEIVVLEDIENFYNQLIEVQSKFKETYKEYSEEELELSPTENLNIDYYVKRKEAIKGYLLNKKNSEKARNKLAEVNNKLYEEEQKKIRFNKKIKLLDEELISKFLSSEGRTIEIENEKEVLKPTSIVREYAKLGIVLTKEGYTGKTIEEADNLDKESKEKFDAATISYEVMPTSEKKRILEDINKEKIMSSYQLAMVKLLEEVYKESLNYETAIEKREKILDLLKYRTKYLSDLGIRHGIDPFSRIKLEEQINLLNEFGNNTLTITRLRKEMASLNEQLESFNINNTELVVQLDEKKPELVTINEEKNVSIEDKITLNDYKNKVAEKQILPNQVMEIKDVSPRFNRRKCIEITQAVIKRVYSLIKNEIPNKVTVNPELEITVEKQEIAKPKIDLDEFGDIFETIDENELFGENNNINNEKQEELIDIPVIAEELGYELPEIETPFDNEISNDMLFKDKIEYDENDYNEINNQEIEINQLQKEIAEESQKEEQNEKIEVSTTSHEKSEEEIELENILNEFTKTFDENNNEIIDDNKEYEKNQDVDLYDLSTIPYEEIVTEVAEEPAPVEEIEAELPIFPYEETVTEVAEEPAPAEEIEAELPIFPYEETVTEVAEEPAPVEEIEAELPIFPYEETVTEVAEEPAPAEEIEAELPIFPYEETVTEVAEEPAPIEEVEEELPTLPNELTEESTLIEDIKIELPTIDIKPEIIDSSEKNQTSLEEKTESNLQENIFMDNIPFEEPILFNTKIEDSKEIEEKQETNNVEIEDTKEMFDMNLELETKKKETFLDDEFWPLYEEPKEKIRKR